MMSNKLLLSFGIGLTVMCAGCKDNNYVDEDWCLDKANTVPVMVNVNLDKSFTDYASVDSTHMDGSLYRSTRGDPTMLLEYHVAAYEKGKSTPVDVFSSSESPVKVRVHPGKYTFVSWVNYTTPIVDAKGYYFNLDDFSEIMLKHKYDYEGSDSYKVPFRGRDDHSIAFTTKEVETTATPAMAKFRLIATDKAEFTPYKCVVSFNSLPSAINGLSGKINYSWTDVHFDSLIKDDVLACDYVFSENDKETEISVKLEIYDRLGNLCARMLNLKIPLKNGGVTTVKGNFYSILDLTGMSAGGISIDTEFEGTFEIEI